jgi:hypothetical protein
MSRGKGKRILALVEEAYRILKKIEPATVRAVCYQLFVRGLIPDMGKSSTNSVSRALVEAREEKEIPWEWIVDESREAERTTLWSNPDQIISAAVRGYRRDYWQDQDYHVEVWSEKGTIRGTLAPVLDQYGVTFRVMHGYASATVVNTIAELSQDLEDKLFVALYVGDWDPSGLHMSEVDLPERLDQYGGDVQVERVALVKPDLTGLPSFDVKSKSQDPRYQWFRENIRGRCYELDAMSPPLLRQRVEAEIRRYIDIPKWDHARMIERAEVQSMREFHKSWQASISSRMPTFKPPEGTP